jgi:calcium-dependent protein kinase
MGIEHLHSQGICHRDLKPENICFEEQYSLKVRIIDFGLSKQVVEGKSRQMTTQMGTPYYLCPELIKGIYNFKCDIWSVGIITYLMLCGTLPFHGSNQPKLFEKILTHQPVFESDSWSHMSKEAICFVIWLL